MGADGGVVYIPLSKGTPENYARVAELLRPFWQFLDGGGRAFWAREATDEWEKTNTIGPPQYVFGYYGTDRCDNFSLSDLAHLVEVAENDPDWRGDLCALTFEEFDLDYRTTPEPTKRGLPGSYYLDTYPFHRLWHEHFEYDTHEEVLADLGGLAGMTLREWATELDGLLQLGRTVTEETWT